MRAPGNARTMVGVGTDEQTVHPLPPAAGSGETAAERRRRQPAIRAYASVIALLGATGATLVLAALVFAPGAPVYVAIVGGVLTGGAAARWARR
jgi:hypothetical protein